MIKIYSGITVERSKMFKFKGKRKKPDNLLIYKIELKVTYGDGARSFSKHPRKNFSSSIVGLLWGHLVPSEKTLIRLMTPSSNEVKWKVN